MGKSFPWGTRESLKQKWSQNRLCALDKYKGRLEDGSLKQRICFSSSCIQWQTFVLCILTYQLQKGIKIEILWSAIRNMLCQRLLKKSEQKNKNLRCCLFDCTVGGWTRICTDMHFHLSECIISPVIYYLKNVPWPTKIKSKVHHASEVQIKRNLWRHSLEF